MHTMSSDPPAKLSFGFTKQQTQRRFDTGKSKKETESRQAIEAIEDGGKLRMAGGQVATTEDGSKQYIVPRLENTFQTGVGNKEGAAKKFTPSFKPPKSDAAVGDTEERFEAAEEDTRPKITQYGLEKRVRPEDVAAAEGQTRDHRGEGSVGGKGHKPYVPPAKLEEAALERDVQGLPEEAPVEAYKNLPIEEFGKAMLRGMGWTEGMGVGRNRKQAQPIEYLKRPERLGLGAASVPDKDAGRSKVVKMGDKPVVNRADLVLRPDADGRQRHVRTLDEKLVHRSEVEPGPRPGKTMQIVGGRHKGLACRVIELLPQKENRSSYATVKLLLSNEAIDVRCSDLAESGQQHQQPEAARHEHSTRSKSRSRGKNEEDGKGERRQSGREASGKEVHERGRKGGDDGGSGLDRGRGSRQDGSKREHKEETGRHEEGRQWDAGGERESKRRHVDRVEDEGREKPGGSEEESEEEEEAAPGAVKRSWLAPYIKVRIVDKRVRGGRLYLKKGTVVDVHPRGLCDVSMDEGNDVVQLGQAALETVVPKELGAAVLVVEGPLRGHKARVQAKTAEACAVQLESDFSMQRLLLDEVAMYVGPMDDD